MAVYAFIDTNVPLHFTFFRDVDWARELKAEAVTLVFAGVVIEELDKRKWSGSRREKDRARTMLRALDGLGLGVTPVAVREAVTAMGLDAEPDDEFLKTHRLQARNADDRLLAAAIAFKAACGAGDRVLIVSDDSGIRIKAGTRRIEVFALPDRLALPDEPDETERALESMRRELAAVNNAAPDMRVSLEGATPQDSTIQLAGALEPALREELLSVWRQRHPRVKARPRERSVTGFGPLPGGAWGGYTEEGAADHNADIERCFAEFQTYLDEWPEALNAMARCVRIEPVLDNRGSTPANDLEMVLWTDAKGIWREDPPQISRHPPRHPRAVLTNFCGPSSSGRILRILAWICAAMTIR